MTAQTMNEASDEAEQVVQSMAGNHLANRFDSGSAHGSGGHVAMQRMHTVQGHTFGGGTPSRGFGGRRYMDLKDHIPY